MTTTSGVTAKPVDYGPIGTFPALTGGEAKAPPKSKTELDKDTFLKLLVAQMKYQDPNAPTDPSQFLSQTAQFTTVEKLDAMEDLSQKAYDSGRQLTATSMIGLNVTYTDPTGKSQKGLVSSVTVGAATPLLTVGKAQVALDAVSSVSTT